jgi:hypothetical protein
MTLPALPDWLPWWVPIVLLIPVGLWALTMVLMPFSVIGLKSRLEGIELRLDEVQAEIRSLALRLPESPAERISYRQGYMDDRAPPLDQAYINPAPPHPPIPPAPRNDFIPRRPAEPEPRPRDREDRPPTRDDRPAPSPRAEPRLDWRR